MSPNQLTSEQRSTNTLLAAVGNASTGYNLVNISIAMILITEYEGHKPTNSQDSSVNSFVFVGAILGQLTFGIVGDTLGRQKAMRLTTAFTIAGALGSATCVGGVYPLAATVATESSEAGRQGRNTALVFSTQGIGQVMSPVMAYFFWDVVSSQNNIGGWDWRLLLGFGIVPSAVVAWFKGSETRQKSKSKSENEDVEPVEDGESPSELEMQQLDDPLPNQTETSNENERSNTDDSLALSCSSDGDLDRKRLGVIALIRSNPNVLVPKLMGTAACWFLFDICFYANVLFAPKVLAAIFGSEDDDGADPRAINSKIEHTLIVYLIGLPGYFVSVVFMDSLGRKNIQILGFLAMAFLYLLIAIRYSEMGSSELIVMYGLTFFFSNFGPNTTTFILSSETFDPEYRTTLNGFCAASGKLGALLGTFAFPFITDGMGMAGAFALCATVAGIGGTLSLKYCEDLRSGQGSDDGYIVASPLFLRSPAQSSGNSQGVRMHSPATKKEEWSKVDTELECEGLDV